MPFLSGDKKATQASIKVLANEVFATEEIAAKWLHTRHMMLGSMTPWEHALTKDGFERVVNLLISSRHGGVA